MPLQLSAFAGMNSGVGVGVGIGVAVGVGVEIAVGAGVGVCLVVLLSWHEEQMITNATKKITGMYFITIPLELAIFLFIQSLTLAE
jgi:hypothetical protein